MRGKETKAMINKTLSELKPGEKGRITKVTGGGAVRRRILDMGVIPGSEIKVERIAPLGDPIEVRIRGYRLSFRKNEATNIYLEVAE